MRRNAFLRYRRTTPSQPLLRWALSRGITVDTSNVAIDALTVAIPATTVIPSKLFSLNDVAKMPKRPRPKNDCHDLLDKAIASDPALLNNAAIDQFKTRFSQLERNPGRIITIARFLHAMNIGDGAPALHYKSMVILISKYFNISIPDHNIGNFARRVTHHLNDANQHAACLFLIFHYWKFINSLSQSLSTLVYRELSHELMIEPLYKHLVNNEPFSTIHNMTYGNISQAIITLFHIKSSNITNAYDMLIGHGGSSRTYFTYREAADETNESVITCRIEIYKDPISDLLRFRSYGYSDGRRTVESYGYVVPMDHVIYLLGARTNASSLKIYAIPADYSNSLPISFTGLIMAVDPSASDNRRPLFAARVYFSESDSIPSAPSLIDKNRIAKDILRSIENNIPRSVGKNVFNTYKHRIKTIHELSNYLGDTIESAGDKWFIVDEKGQPLNILNTGVVSTFGVLVSKVEWNEG